MRMFAGQMPVSEGDQGTRAALAAYRSLRHAVQTGAAPDQVRLACLDLDLLLSDFSSVLSAW